MKLSKQKIFSILESLLFISPDPTPLSQFVQAFEGEFSEQELSLLLKEFAQTLKKEERGLYLESINKGYQLRTKIENKSYLLKSIKKRVFRLSSPALEALSIIAYKQPCPKQEVDQIRGVSSDHLLRTLLEKELIVFAGKSDLPGKPSLYKTSAKFLEIFGFNSLKDLPSEEEINELLPEVNKPTTTKTELHHITDHLSENHLQIPYDQDEKENQKLKDSLKSIPTTVEFLVNKKEDLPNTDEKEESKNTEQEPLTES